MITSMQGQNSLKDKGIYILSYTHDIIKTIMFFADLLSYSYSNALFRN